MSKVLFMKREQNNKIKVFPGFSFFYFHFNWHFTPFSLFCSSQDVPT
jgi:hypothetical protein